MHDDGCCYYDDDYDNDDGDDSYNYSGDSCDDCYSDWVCNSRRRPRDCSLVGAGVGIAQWPVAVAVGAHGGAGSRAGWHSRSRSDGTPEGTGDTRGATTAGTAASLLRHRSPLLWTTII